MIELTSGVDAYGSVLRRAASVDGRAVVERFGVLPGEVGVSWQAHLGGFGGGALSARWFARGLPSFRLRKTA
ncbi:hypothetical protein D3C83_178370 [compost metagenome]